MKKLLSIVLLLCITTCFLTSVYAVDYGEELKNAPLKTYEQKFSDVPEDYWAYNYIAEMAERGVLSGYPDGKFYPNSPVTRAEFAKIMTVAAGLSITAPKTQPFSDVQITDWYAPYVHAAKDYLSAYNQNGSSYYLPNTTALREDIAVALVKLKGYSITGADMTALPRMFSDHQSISENAKIYVASAIENGLISGYDDGTFKGQNGITRAEAATLLWRAYQYGNANKTYGSTEETSTGKDSLYADTQEVVEDKKPYTMRTLVEVALEKPGTSTTDKENIYYVNNSDNCIYQTNLNSGDNIKYFDSRKITSVDIVVDGKAYRSSSEGLNCTLDSYVPFQVFYDSKYDRLLLSGYYETMYKELDTWEGTYCVIHDITNGDAKLIGFLDHWDSARVIQAVLSEYEILMSSYSMGNTKTYGASFIFKNKIYRDYKDITYMSFPGTIRKGNFLYSLESDMGDVNVIRCDVSSNEFETVARGDVNWYAATNDCYYFIENIRSTHINKFNTKDEKISRISIDFSNDVYSAETISLNNFSTRFFVIDDNTMIFYDEYMEAFRILEKN